MAECAGLLGSQPPQWTASSGAVKLQWFRDQFRVFPANLIDIEVEQYARGYILHMFVTRFPPQIRYISDGYLFYRILTYAVLCLEVAIGSCIKYPP